MKKAIMIGVLAALLCGCGQRYVNQKQINRPIASIAALFDDTEAKDDVRYLDELPANYKDGDTFGLILEIGDYAMDVSAWPMHDGYWLITSHWCIEEDADGTIVRLDEYGNEVPVEYNDPFEGRPYPVVHHSMLSFGTRNYSGETIHFFAAPDSDEVLCETNLKEITLHVIDADLTTRRLLAYSYLEDWCWLETQDPVEEEYRYEYVPLKGWIDEDWVCGNTMTTCP